MLPVQRPTSTATGRAVGEGAARRDVSEPAPADSGFRYCGQQGVLLGAPCFVVSWPKSFTPALRSFAESADSAAPCRHQFLTAAIDGSAKTNPSVVQPRTASATRPAKRVMSEIAAFIAAWVRGQRKAAASSLPASAVCCGMWGGGLQPCEPALWRSGTGKPCGPSAERRGTVFQPFRAEMLTAYRFICTLPTYATQADRRARDSGQAIVTALRIFLARLLGLFGGDTRRERELRAEIDGHLAEAAGEYVRQGMTPEEARHAALRQFGGVTQTIEAHRAQRRFTLFSTLWQDLRYAVRTLTRAPGFAIVAILTLAIGILGNTTIFSGVNALLFTPLPAERPEQIAQVDQGRRHGPTKHTYKLFTALRDNNSSFTALAAIKDVTVPISDTAQSARMEQHTGVARGEVASGTYFDMLGVRAAQGRVFRPDDDRTPNAHPVVVISDRLWRAHFNGDPGTLGRVTYLNGNPFTIIGILPPTFTGTLFATETDFWAPLMMQGQLGDDPNWFRPEAARMRPIVISCMTKIGGGEDCSPPREQGDLRLLGRLKADVTTEAASAQLTAIAANMPRVRDRGRSLPPPTIAVVAELEGRQENHLPQVRAIATLALCASGLVWLIACGNVANLFLARATVRRREIAIRLAMGAGRWRVVRQLLTESTLLALTAGTIAVVLTFWTAGVLAAAIPANVQLPITLDFTPDLRLLGWALALSFVTGLAFGSAPALQAVRTSLVPSLKPGESGSSQGARRLTLRNALVVVQFSISVVVLIAGGLFVRSLENAREAFSPGFDADRMVSMRLDPGVLGYKAPRIEAVYRDVLRQLTEIPRIESASLVSSPPFGSYGSAGATIRGDGSPTSTVGSDVEASVCNAGPRYFQTMGIPIAAGRDFDERDVAKSTQVAILSEAEARRLFGSAQHAIGKRIRANEDGTPTRLEVVGVVNDKSRAGGPGEDVRVLYVPSLQREPGKEMTLVVRASSSADLISLRNAVVRTLQQVDPVLPVSEIRTGEDHADPQLGAVRLTAEVSMLLGLVALTLAGLGLYGVISYAVSARTREIGIRMALGAHSTNVRALIIRHGMLLTAVGLVIGLGGSLLLTPVLQSFLIDLPASDSVTFGAVTVALVAIALVASYVPARRATRIDPIATLRTE
jgi:putative ABC transport system permease protein